MSRWIAYRHETARRETQYPTAHGLDREVIVLTRPAQSWLSRLRCSSRKRLLHQGRIRHVMTIQEILNVSVQKRCRPLNSLSEMPVCPKLGRGAPDRWCRASAAMTGADVPTRARFLSLLRGLR